MFNFVSRNEKSVVVETLHGNVEIFYEPMNVGTLPPDEAFLQGMAYAVLFNCGLPHQPATNPNEGLEETQVTREVTEEI